MNKIFLSVTAALVITMNAALTPAVATENKVSTTTMTKDQCLSCHGPLDVFLKKDVKYETGGQVINPHRPVPHDSTKAEDFPDCVNCHKPHTLPPPKGFKDTKVEVSICYDCHHNYKFEACSQCHK